VVQASRESALPFDAIKTRCEEADSCPVTDTRQCRICGAIWPYPSHYWITDGGGCRSCEGSPLCDACGHPRSNHVAVFRKGAPQCNLRALDVQSLSRLECDCAGYAAVEGRLSEAEFAQPETGPLPKLRVVGEDSPGL